MVNLLIVYLLIQNSLQYRFSSDDYSEDTSSDTSRRTLKRYKYRHRIGTFTRLYPSVSDSESYTDYSWEKRRCSCRRCKRPKRRCRYTCKRCLAPPPQSFMVPYPVPYIMPVVVEASTVATTTVTATSETTSTNTTTTTESTTTAQTTTTETTTTETTTVTTPIIMSTSTTHMVTVFRRNSLLPIGLNKRLCGKKGCDTIDVSAYKGIKRSVVNRLSRFGIVPIPDDLAERLIKESQKENLIEMPISKRRYNGFSVYPYY